MSCIWTTPYSLVGLRNAVAGKPNTAKVHRMPELDVKAVCEQTGFTQAKFAQTFAISLGTLRHWERGDRKPSGTALVLLHAVDRPPNSDEIAECWLRLVGSSTNLRQLTLRCKLT